MSSVITGFEYDVFISYRHKDNKYDGWVTEFVTNLQKELEATFKEDISIYFDTNPHDGLLETHNVDKSLEGKLKCLIFIPIISQTYCDIKSFAWQHEFVAFNKLSKEDQFGRDIKLSNGNVASRILPIKIHDLDTEDKTLLENELGGVLRAIEFIFKSPGVNRPLTSSDKREENSNKTFYRDQVNKVANAIKEIISSLKNPPSNSAQIPGNMQPVTQPPASRTKILVTLLLLIILVVAGYFLYSKLFSPVKEEDVLDKSIAVLPFTDMSPNHDQEYLGDGIAEEIITALSGIKELKVIGRTSSFQFKGDKVDLRDIGEKLDVATVLEGSVQKAGDNVRITAQLIKVKDGSHIWSERYDRKMIDIFSVQDEISKHISEKLKLTLFERPGGVTENIPTKNMEAYEMWLKGNHFIRNGPEDAEKAVTFFQKAINLDSTYAEAYLGLAWGYFFSTEFGVRNNFWLAKVKGAVEKALSLNLREEKSYELMLAIYLYEWNWVAGKREYDKWFSVNSSGATSQAVYLRMVYGDFRQAIQMQEEFVKKDPLNLEALRILASNYTHDKQYRKARGILKKALEIDTAYSYAYISMGWNYYLERNYELAFKNYEEALKLVPDSKYILQLYCIALASSAQKDRAKRQFKILNEDSQISDAFKAEFYFALGELDQAFRLLNTAYERRDPYLANLRVGAIYDPYRSDPRFQELMKKMNFPNIQ